MQLHLLSSPGAPIIQDVVEIARPILVRSPKPEVAYLPAGATERHFLRETRTAFRRLARVTLLKVESDPLEKLRLVLRRVTLLYIPGGNTYLMAHRLHTRGWMDLIRQRLLEGLPFIGFSAGAMLCGLDILTTNDLNCCGCTHFTGLGLVPYNFNMHYPTEEGEARQERDGRMWEYHLFHDQPVLAMQDNAYIRSIPEGLELVRGNAWLFEKGKLRAKLNAGSF